MFDCVIRILNSKTRAILYEDWYCSEDITPSYLNEVIREQLTKDRSRTATINPDTAEYGIEMEDDGVRSISLYDYPMFREILPQAPASEGKPTY